MRSTKQNKYLHRCLMVTLVREIVSILTIITLMILKKDPGDIVTFICCSVKVFILSANGYYLIKKYKTEKRQPRMWLLCCVLDASFSMQMLISVLFYSCDVPRSQVPQVSPSFGFTYYLMIFIIADVLLNLNILFLFGLGVNHENREGLKKYNSSVSNDLGKWITLYGDEYKNGANLNCNDKNAYIVRI